MDDILSTLISYLSYLPVVIFFGSPIIAIIVAISRLSQYQDAKLQQIIKPGSCTDEDIKDMKKGVVTSFTVALVLLAVVGGLTALFAMSIAYM